MKRYVKIIRILMQCDRYIAIDELADIFGVSSRSIRSDLDAIDSYLSNTGVIMNRSRKMGVQLNKEELQDDEVRTLLANVGLAGERYGGDNRTDCILQYVLLHSQRFTIDEIVSQTQISKNTVMKELDICKAWLEKRNVFFGYKKRFGTFLACTEQDWRNAAVDFVNLHISEFDYQKLYVSSLDDDFIITNQYVSNFIHHFTEDIDTACIKRFIQEYEDAFHIKFSDEAFVSIYMYLCISVKRCKEGMLLTNAPQISPEYDKNLQWINCHAKCLRDITQVDENEMEIRALLMRLLDHGKLYDGIKTENGTREKRLVEAFVHKTEQYLCTSLTDSVLYSNLLVHLESAIHRILSNKFITNPLTKEIKLNYPQIFRACTAASEVFVTEYGMLPSEDEIAYLSIHVAASIERTRDNTRKQKPIQAIVVCSSGVGTSNMLCSRLRTEFPDLVVKGISSVKDIFKIDEEDVDLLVSTVPLSMKIKKSVIYVSPLLSPKDIQKLRTYMQKRSASKDSNDFSIDGLMTMIEQECTVTNRSKLKTNLLRYFNTAENVFMDNMPSLVELVEWNAVLLCAHAADADDAIGQAGRLLYNSGVIQEDFITDLIESRTQLGKAIVISPGIAMPHAMSKHKVFRTAISFFTLREPVSFTDSESDAVWLVITLCVKDHNTHLRALSELMQLIENSERLLALQACKSPEQLMLVLNRERIQS